MFLTAGVTRVMDLLDTTRGQWRTVQSLADQVGIRSVRMVEGMVKSFKAVFPPVLTSLIDSVLIDGLVFKTFPELKVVPKKLELEENTNSFLLKGFEFLDFQRMGKKIIYHICAKSAHFEQLKDRIDTKWRAYLSVPRDVNPSWRLLYKPPVPKRCGDLQWRILHSVLATNNFVSKFNEMVLPECSFCKASDTVFHLFCECSRLAPLFVLLGTLITKLGFSFTNTLFIFGCKYNQSCRERCVLANFFNRTCQVGNPENTSM